MTSTATSTSAAARKVLLRQLTELRNLRPVAESITVKNAKEEFKRAETVFVEARRKYHAAVNESKRASATAEYRREAIEAELTKLMPPNWAIAIRALRRADSIVGNRAGTEGGFERDKRLVELIRTEITLLEKLLFDEAADPAAVLEESAHRMRSAVRVFGEIYDDMSRDIPLRSSRVTETA